MDGIPILENLEDIYSLADTLKKKGLISADQLAVARVTLKNRGGDLGTILINKGFLTREKLLEFIDNELHLPKISLRDYAVDPAVVKLMPQSFAKLYKCIPILWNESVLIVAMAEPLFLFSINQIKNIVKCDVQPVLIPKEELDVAIESHYRLADLSTFAEEGIEISSYSDEADIGDSESLEEMASGAKIVSAVNNLIFKAYEDNASDIHIEPMRNQLKIRYRVDGLLEERMLLPKSLHLPIVSSLKIMGGMDIAERRVPQDGRVRLKLKGEGLDLRLSTFPTMYGEKMVLRLLPKGRILTLEDLGFSKKEKGTFTDIISQPYGIFLVTGPTGSGKSTTLYAALQKINSQERNIISIEDPIENEIPGINQAQVNIKAGVTFATALKSILRQDPDVIMVGEIRDAETADIAVRSAMTGHLVFSTLHTNTAIGAVARLIDLGLEPFLISSALLGVMAQRLVRKICSHCKEEVKYDKEQLSLLLGKDAGVAILYKGKGCKKCRMSGYAGRTGIFELVHVDDKMKNMIARKASEDEILEYAKSKGVLSIRGAAIKEALDGNTTLEEVLRVTEKA